MPIEKPFFVTGIGTGIGKTLISAILTEKLRADYWKPVQSGDLDNSDTDKVRSLVTNTKSHFHQETYRLTQPFSPHKSAAIDGISIEADKFIVPQTHNRLIIEGAGGLMVPLNEDFVMIDLIKQLQASVILVSMNYLGSINHTLLSAFTLAKYNIPVAGIIFNGPEDTDSESFILKYTGIPKLGSVTQFETINRACITEAGKNISI